MAKNFIQEGERATYTNTTGSAILSGAVVIIGAFAAIALVDIADTETGTVALCGVWELGKTNPLVIAQGDEVFWNTSTKLVTKTATDKAIGTAFVAAGSTDDVVQVKIYGSGNGIPVASTVAALTGTPTGTANGSIVDVAATAASTAGGSTPTAGQVDTGIATAVASIVTGVNEQNKEFQTTINAILTALKAAGLMA